MKYRSNDDGTGARGGQGGPRKFAAEDKNEPDDEEERRALMPKDCSKDSKEEDQNWTLVNENDAEDSEHEDEVPGNPNLSGKNDPKSKNNKLKKTQQANAADGEGRKQQAKNSVTRQEDLK